PNELTTIFYMEATHEFFREFLKDNYNLEIDEVLEEFVAPEDLATFQLRKATSSHELDKLSKLSKVHPVGALLSAYAYLEKQLSQIREIINDNAQGHYDNQMRMRIMRYSSPDFLPRLFDEYNLELSKEERKKIF